MAAGTMSDTAPPSEDASHGFDLDSLKAKYVAEQNKRIHGGGTGQYRSIEGSLANYIEDPYVELGFARDPVDLDCDVVVIGGGYGGQLVAARLIEQGINNFRIIEKGGDFGGTGTDIKERSAILSPISICHFWRRRAIPTEKYAHGDELRAHAVRIGKSFDLYPRTFFQTEVLALRWNDSEGSWSVETNRKDNIRSRFVIPVAGPLHRPKLPGLRGIESFQGRSFHSSRWDYNYTGGNVAGGLTKLADKRVGIIGTGATAVQIVPQLGEYAKEVHVFQRTPSSIDIRNNIPTDWEWAKTLKKGWQQERMENFNTILGGGHEEVDLVADAWTGIFRFIAPDPTRLRNKEMKTTAADIQHADFKKMEELRARVATVVKDKDRAESLKPWYNYYCKRPCCHDEYLEAFNRPNVNLIDTDGQGVEAITPKGAIANGKEYDLDCLIYATGFEWGTDWTYKSGMEIYGRNGVTMTERWRDGALTYHGWGSYGFPNCFYLSPIQAATTPNHMYVTGEQARHFAYIISQCQKRSIRNIEPTVEAEKAWVAESVETGKARQEALRGCTPGYLNNEGEFTLRAARNAPYGGGSIGFL